VAVFGSAQRTITTAIRTVLFALSAAFSSASCLSASEGQAEIHFASLGGIRD